MSSTHMLRNTLKGLCSQGPHAARVTLPGLSVLSGNGTSIDTCRCHSFVTESPGSRQAHTDAEFDSDEEDVPRMSAGQLQQQLKNRLPTHQQPAARQAVITEGPLAKYEEGKEAGLYRPDPRQEVTIQMLQDVYNELRAEYQPPVRPSGLTMVDNVAVKQSKSSWWTGVSHLLRSSGGLKPQPHLKPAHHINGVYMYGGVGVGKTMLMDLFVHSAPKEFQVVRAHFHDFMLDVHSKLKQFKDQPQPLLAVADSIAEGCKVLCLDELFVTDVADAMILNRLFGRLWDRGLTLIATSNRPPVDLYKGGLQRQLFLPFIHKLQEECRIHNMASPTDYRRLAHHAQGMYLLTPDREQLLQERAEAMAGGRPLRPEDVEVAMGRTLHVPAAAGPVCKFSFHDLCGRPLGAADYIALTQHYHTLCLSGVPRFGAANRPEAYRFVTLVDVLYEHRVRAVISADGTPAELFANVVTNDEAHAAEHRAMAAGKAAQHDTAALVVDDNLGFVRERTISRLTEMGSLEYLQAHARQHCPALLLALHEAADKSQGKAGRTTHICHGEVPQQPQGQAAKEDEEEEEHAVGFT